jgi:hypothetical protein
MAWLFNAFAFGGYSSFDPTREDDLWLTAIPWTSGDSATSESAPAFIDIFGLTEQKFYQYLNADNYRSSGAIYGDDADGDGFHKNAVELDDATRQLVQNGMLVYPEVLGRASLFGDNPLAAVSSSGSNPGVALVSELSPVALPSTAWLFGSAILGAGLISRRKTKPDLEKA